MVEFTLAAVPMIFATMSVVWIGLGMWEYHTLAMAVGQTTRYAAVHGAGCAGQTCAITLDQLAKTLAGRAVGIPAHQISVTLTSSAKSYSSALLDSYYGNTTAWPSLAGNTAVTTNITITATYSFSSGIAMLGGVNVGALNLGATSTQPVLY
jgi:hypothetical protein